MERVVEGTGPEPYRGFVDDTRRRAWLKRRSSAVKDPSFDTTSTIAKLVRPKSQHR